MGKKRYAVNEKSFFATRASVGAYWDAIRKARRKHESASKSVLSSASKVVVVNPKQEPTELERLVCEERRTTAAWYDRVSGQVPWVEGERQKFREIFADLEGQIHRFQGEQSVD